jgi:NAD(P)-dependent dehydrogenase (short-subunit alcohol dehydrogenase family)
MNLVVTGSSSGIGHALAKRLLQQGHSVWGLARSDQSESARQFGQNFFSTRCDIADWRQVESAAQAIGVAWGRLDGLVACAAVHGEIGRALTADPIRWGATIRANLDGTFNCLRALHPLLSKSTRRAKIICFSGGGATKARPRFSAYGSAKCAVVRLVETIAEEEKGSPLDINAIAPGAISTRLTKEILALGPGVVGEAEFKSAERMAHESEATLNRALDLVDWLLSEASDGISGRLISAQWDPWPFVAERIKAMADTDIYTLRRVLPEERGAKWSP